jgi:hypothetical protein
VITFAEATEYHDTLLIRQCEDAAVVGFDGALPAGQAPTFDEGLTAVYRVKAPRLDA